MKNGFGGAAGGGVSATETLPDFVGTGIHGLGSSYASGDRGHTQAGVEKGRTMHGMGACRGGHYHCMGDGCSYVTRSKDSMSRHAAAANRKHGMTSMGGSSASSASSGSFGSSVSTPSSSAMGSSQSHGMMSSYSHGDVHGAGAKKTGAKAPLGEGGRFKALTAKLERKGADDPKALAAWIGREKLGAKRFAALSAQGRKDAKKK